MLILINYSEFKRTSRCGKVCKIRISPVLCCPRSAIYSIMCKTQLGLDTQPTSTHQFFSCSKNMKSLSEIYTISNECERDACIKSSWPALIGPICPTIYILMKKWSTKVHKKNVI